VPALLAGHLARYVGGRQSYNCVDRPDRPFEGALSGRNVGMHVGRVGLQAEEVRGKEGAALPSLGRACAGGREWRMDSAWADRLEEERGEMRLWSGIPRAAHAS
jgi:hypothetical protein